MRDPFFQRYESGKADCLFLEIFAGSCRLSKACKEAGLRCTAVDKDPKRSEQFPVYICDLGDAEQFDLLKSYIEAEKESILHVHFAPGCGTASRAREKPIPGDPDPPRPLRSDSFPDGLPNLTAEEQQRVETANSSYRAMCTLILFLVSLSISISIENPKNSILWLTSFLRSMLEALPRYHVCVFQHCMHGGRRDKATAWYSFNPRDPKVDLFASLGLLCNKQHRHAPWKPYINRRSREFFPQQKKLHIRICCVPGLLPS